MSTDGIASFLYISLMTLQFIPSTLLQFISDMNASFKTFTLLILICIALNKGGN